MRAWTAPHIPPLPIRGPTVALYDTPTRALVRPHPAGPATLYVCGITPYDATHIGHAATYVAFDLLNRAWRNAGLEVTNVQNVTDVDDPLLERARTLDVAWEKLAADETERFRDDMTALRVVPPTHYVGVVESMQSVIALIGRLETAGSIYQLDDDLYFRVEADPAFGQVSGLGREAMLSLFADRGGDPERVGKDDPLDCLVWRGEREGEPSWPSPWGPGRPGWHVECTAIAREHLGEAFDVQAGGSDLVFPHHEMTAGMGQVAQLGHPFAQSFVHAGMVAYEGSKMSKSLGNLVFVSALRDRGTDPMAIRLAILRHHHRCAWEWLDADLVSAEETLTDWRRALQQGGGAPTAPFVRDVLAALADDLDAPRAMSIVQAWVDLSLGGGLRPSARDPDAGDQMRSLLDAALGLAL